MPDRHSKPSTPAVKPHVASLARHVLAEVNRRTGRARQSRIAGFAHWLSEEVLRLDDYDSDRVLAELGRLGLSIDEFVTDVIPRAAATLGDRWCDDEVSFAKVSMGSARLQSLCHRASPEWRHVSPEDSGQSFLLCTMDSEDHMIACTVLSYVLRQRGHSVRSLAKASSTEIVHHLNSGSFDCLLFSCAVSRDLANVVRTVRAVRSSVSVQVFIALGGHGVTEAMGQEAMLGVDLVTNDINLVLNRLGCPTTQALLSAAE